MFDKDLFKNIMAQSATLVYIITTNGPHGKFGLTVNTLCSVTDSPAMVLFCVNKNSSIYNFIESHEMIGVNFLSSNQQDLAQEFAGGDKYNRENRFKGDNFKLTKNNQIIFNDSLAFLEGEVEDRIVKGTHVVYFIKIMDGMLLKSDKALVYWNRGFKHLF